MAKKGVVGAKTDENRVIGFHPMSLAIFSVALVLASGLLGSGLLRQFPRLGSGGSSPSPAPGEGSWSTGTNHPSPPWGELMTSEIWVERPEEYVAFQVNTN